MKIENGERAKWLTLLKSVKFFKAFDDSDIAVFLDTGDVRHHKLHDYIFREGENGDSFYVILRGSVKIIKQGHHHEKKEVGNLEAGDNFGEMGLLMGLPRTASILTASDSYILKINAQDINSMPQSTQVKVYRAFAEFLAMRLKVTTEEKVFPNFY
ncbi:MAG: cyclic nucleotide-binding domain-containing protein [Nitrospinae bacterium]|nr:cyclic nucleotide-binding domain-containing protein [Nitrospinota bacterium]